METTLGKRIGMLRRQKGLKQEELAAALGVSPQAVSKWENDQTCPDISLLPKLATLLGISVDELLSGEEELLLSATLLSLFYSGWGYIPSSKPGSNAVCRQHPIFPHIRPVPVRKNCTLRQLLQSSGQIR